MKLTRDQVLAEFLSIVQSMGDDWEDSSATSEDAKIVGDLNWQSIQIVYIVNMLQERFGQPFPMEGFLERIQQQGSTDVTVREWVDFIHEHLQDDEQSALKSRTT